MKINDCFHFLVLLLSCIQECHRNEDSENQITNLKKTLFLLEHIRQ